MNGNSLLKLGYANGRGFSFQLNNTGLNKTKSLLSSNSLSELSEAELATIEKEAVAYIKANGSDTQKKKLKTY